MPQHLIREILAPHSIVPVVAFEKKDDPLRLTEYLLQQEIRCIEVTLRTAYAEKAMRDIRSEFGSEMTIGAGTVVKEDQLKSLKDLDIDFLVSPGTTPALIHAFEASKIAYLPGVTTPSEIIQAIHLGLDTLKFFPAELFGGIKTIKTYQSVFSDLKFCPTGGITKESAQEYLSLKNVIAVGGSWIQKDFKNYTTITQ